MRANWQIGRDPVKRGRRISPYLALSARALTPA
jgi:hypothetical protein